MNPEDTLYVMRSLLTAAHEAEVGRQIQAADALGATAANLLAGYLHRETKVTPLRFAA